MQRTDKELNMNLMPLQILICEGRYIHVLLNIHKEKNSHQKKEKKYFLTNNYKKSGFGDG